MGGSLVVLTGASGSGKTTIARRVQSYAVGEVCFFDSIGVPTVEQMVQECGSGEGWQRAMTLAWMQRIAIRLRNGKSVLFEGQMRIAFIEEALSVCHVDGARVILVDCDDATRAARLHRERDQPELADPTMMHWAKYLRDEAEGRGCEVLDTSRCTVDESAQWVRERLG